MKVLIGLVVPAAFTVASQAKAHGVGNGGEAVVCFNQSVTTSGEAFRQSKLPLVIKSVHLYDFWVWKQKTGLDVALGASTLKLEQKIQLTANRLKKVDIYAASVLESAIQSKFSDIEYTRTGAIPELGDYNRDDIELPANCYIKQIARQKNELRFGEKRILIDGGLFRLLSMDERAGLLQHEYLYTVALGFGAKTSDDLRYYNFMVSSTTNGLDSFALYINLSPSLYGAHATAQIFLSRHWNELMSIGLRLENIQSIQFFESTPFNDGYWTSSYRIDLKDPTPLRLPGGTVTASILNFRDGAAGDVELLSFVGFFDQYIKEVNLGGGKGVVKMLAYGNGKYCNLDVEYGRSVNSSECVTTLEYSAPDGTQFGPYPVSFQSINYTFIGFANGFHLSTYKLPFGTSNFFLPPANYYINSPYVWDSRLGEPIVEIKVPADGCSISNMTDPRIGRFETPPAPLGKGVSIVSGCDAVIRFTNAPDLVLEVKRVNFDGSKRTTSEQYNSVRHIDIYKSFSFGEFRLYSRGELMRQGTSGQLNLLASELLNVLDALDDEGSAKAKKKNKK